MISNHLTTWKARGAILGVEESKYLAADLTALHVLGGCHRQRDVLEISDLLTTLETGLLSLPYAIPGSNFKKVKVTAIITQPV